MQQARMVNTLMVPNTRLVEATTQEQEEFIKMGINYCRAVGLLNYLSMSTWLDIAFTISQLSQYLEHPGTKHWAACVHLLRYHSQTPTTGLNLGSSISLVHIYMDADHVNDKENSYSY
jgi:hypothetical protein